MEITGLLCEDDSRKSCHQGFIHIVYCLLSQGNSGWRWTGEMEIPGMLYEGDFRKSSQWVGLRRDHAKLVVKDKKVYEKFKEHCFLDTRWW